MLKVADSSSPRQARSSTWSDFRCSTTSIGIVRSGLRDVRSRARASGSSQRESCWLTRRGRASVLTWWSWIAVVIAGGIVAIHPRAS
jgi:hypothetical protein